MSHRYRRLHLAVRHERFTEQAPDELHDREGVMEVVGWLLAGLAMAKIVPPPR